MNLQKLYDKLIDQAFHGYWGYCSIMEKHHVIPLSMGGRDTPSNWCYMPIRVHYLLHLILFAMGNTEQIFSLSLIAKRMKRPLPRWLRRELHMKQQMLFRKANVERSRWY